jgi:FkbM family methyltransferase
VRQAIIRILQQTLKSRYRKHIVEILDPFDDMKRLLSGVGIRTVVDGGAYHGELSLRFADMFPDATVYAFEPASAAYATLCDTARQEPRIIPVKYALSSSSKPATLFVNFQDSTNALSPVGEGGRKYQDWQTRNVGRERIRALTLDRWAQRMRLKSVDVLKLDLQGHELEALRGAKRLLQKSTKLIYTEVEFVRIYERNCLFSDVEAFLRSCGFSLYQLYNLASGVDGRLVCGDAIFVSNDPSLS